MQTLSVSEKDLRKISILIKNKKIYGRDATQNEISIANMLKEDPLNLIRMCEKNTKYIGLYESFKRHVCRDEELTEFEYFAKQTLEENSTNEDMCKIPKNVNTNEWTLALLSNLSDSLHNFVKNSNSEIRAHMRQKLGSEKLERLRLAVIALMSDENHRKVFGINSKPKHLTKTKE